MVSPMAREVARITDAATPLVAAGTTTWKMALSLVLPRPYAASRSALGTEVSASSLSEEIMG
jgi:hypothetical protein